MTVNEAMKRMLLADGETSRCLAIGELLERLLAAGGVRRD